MKQIIITRHGQTAANKSFSYNGHTDNPLNAQGLAQAQALALRLQDVPLAAIYSSNLQRAVVTAQTIAQGHNLSVTQVADFKEINFGAWEGLPFQEINEKYHDNFTAFFKSPKDTAPQGGESFAELQKRAWPALQKIVAEQRDDTTILVVCHGGTVRALVCAALGIDLNTVWSIDIDNVSLTSLMYYNNGYNLRYLNNIEKLV